VVFDADGMLVVGERFSERLEKIYGISREVTAPFFEGPLKECQLGKGDLRDVLQEAMAIWGWRGNVDDLMQFWFSVEQQPIETRFKPLVSDLKSVGICLALATNNERYRTEYLRDQAMADWFDVVLGSYQVGFRKPDARYFDALEAHIGPLANAWFWDDREANITAVQGRFGRADLYNGFDTCERALRLLV
jgi:phosphoglycolate phosphatase-like HAD superfamily hydrolase